MRTIHLHGRLGRLFGKTHRFAIETAAEAFRALNANFPVRFLDELRIGSYQVIRGRRHGGMSLGEDELNSFRLGSADLHIVPVVEGSAGGKKKGGALKIILGAVIIGAAIFFSGGTLAAPLAGMSTALQLGGGLSISWGSIATLGLGMSLLGASTLLTPKTQTKDTASNESFSFNGPTATRGQGNAIPVVYGLECIVAAQPISISMTTIDIPLDAV